MSNTGFSAIFKKPQGGGYPPPPSVRGLKVLLRFFIFNFSKSPKCSTDIWIANDPFRKVPKYWNRMTSFQVPNTDTAGTKNVLNPSSANT